MQTTIRDIAKLAGVSHTTVSRALNDSSRISQEKKNEIRQIAARLNYVPNMMARGLNLKHSDTIGVLVNFLADLFFNEILSGVENITNDKGFVLMFITLNIRLC